jgi:hypothetical protein
MGGPRRSSRLAEKRKLGEAKYSRWNIFLMMMPCSLSSSQRSPYEDE